MKILITGANGFVGKNLVEALKNIRDGKDRTRPELVIDEIFCYDIDSSKAELDEYCAKADFVFNLAGVNRPQKNEEFMEGNFGFASILLDTLKKYNNKCSVMISSSIQATCIGRYDSDYGRSKKAGEELMFAYAKETGSKVLVYRFPNLFGKWCRPNYNSAVATFCNNIANDLPITVNDRNVQLELLYIDDLVMEMLDALEGKEHRCEFDGINTVLCDDGKYCAAPTTHKVMLGEIVDLLEKFKEQSTTLIMPEMEMLLDYLKKKPIKVYWTFHDCWNFTGYCTYFSAEKCDKWKTGCHDCGLKKSYSWFFDKSSVLYQKKKKAVQGLDMTIITPSRWLSDLVKQSFLRDCPVNVVYNGINLNLFKPIPSNYRQKNHLENKKIVLGVASEWEARKGLDVFVKLSKRLPDDYKIILVGTNAEIDKNLPANILSIHRTNNQQELAGLYTAADVFVNPTREEVLGMTNIEANACGTPVLTFRTGGSPECIDETSGSVVDCDDIAALEKEIIRVCETKPYSVEACVKRAKTFDQNERFMEYVSPYKL